MTKGVEVATGRQERPALNFNFNKLQAVLCMAASAAASIALIIWVASAVL